MSNSYVARASGSDSYALNAANSTIIAGFQRIDNVGTALLNYSLEPSEGNKPDYKLIHATGEMKDTKCDELVGIIKMVTHYCQQSDGESPKLLTS
ncbi:hypothetical protein Ciccas_009928 [Cichlidogyrus casuarinus]|uniref:Uncharacterized protein n=1 Tax=Cichlidogyrus casuarinus TaxID=1844966 RepID=A0ABD2PVL3_9PLAT